MAGQTREQRRIARDEARTKQMAAACIGLLVVSAVLLGLEYLLRDSDDPEGLPRLLAAGAAVGGMASVAAGLVAQMTSTHVRQRFVAVIAAVAAAGILMIALGHAL